jgi:ankyrin repeat protein
MDGTNDEDLGWLGAMGMDDDEPFVDPFPPLYRAIAGPEHTAGQHGDNLESVRSLVAEREGVNVCTMQGWTPLMVSGSTGQPTIMRMLLRAGANVTARDQQGNSALDWTLHTVKGFGDDVVLTLDPGPAHTECAALLRLASQPWGPETHATFPDEQRQRAVDLLWIGVALAHQRPVHAESPEPLGRAFLDVWECYVLPYAVCRPAEPVTTYRPHGASLPLAPLADLLGVVPVEAPADGPDAPASLS